MKKKTIKEFRSHLKCLGYSLTKSASSFYRIEPMNDKKHYCISGIVLCELLPEYGFSLIGVAVDIDSDSNIIHYALIDR